MSGHFQQTIEQIYRTESRRVLATLIRLLGDFDLAEEALHDAFVVALEKWPLDGLPRNPRAWLVSTGRFRAIDTLRKRARFNAALDKIADAIEREDQEAEDTGEQAIADDRLRLIFTCCHPALSPDAQIALTLREVCGLTTEEVASAFLTRPTAIAQRIVRAKAKIRDARIPYEIPSRDDLASRMDSVLQVVYLVFNEGYSASAGESVVRQDLSSDAIRLGRLLIELMPEPEVKGLLALMLLHESRRPARVSKDGEIILLEDQDRGKWNKDQISEGVDLVQQVLQSKRFGPFTIQAAIAAVHAESESSEKTDWYQIVGLYDVLFKIEPSPVVELNRAVAVAMCDGPEAGIDLINSILARRELAEYHLIYAAKADLCRRAGRRQEAIDAYSRALKMVKQEPERKFLQRRLDELSVHL